MSVMSPQLFAVDGMPCVVPTFLGYTFHLLQCCIVIDKTMYVADYEENWHAVL